MNSVKLFAVIVLLCLLITTAIKPAATFKLLNSTERSFGNPCVKHIQHNANGEIMEVVCKVSSFSCLSSIPTHGYAKCLPVYRFIKQLGETLRGETFRKAVPVDCICA